ncbi:MAG: TOPRIM nucleotidyl transferase/hydrolase domain-containing protein [Candidatus Methanomethylicaceae archaeon]
MLGTTIYWVKREGDQAEFGLVGFDTLPRFLLDIFNLNLMDKHCRLIFSPTKQASWKLQTAVGKKLDQKQWDIYDPEIEKSRYLIFVNPEDGLHYLLINYQAIPTHLIQATVFFMEKSIEYFLALKNPDTSKFVTMLCETQFNYMNKIGIPFIFYEKGNINLVNTFPKNLLKSYAELQASILLLESDLSNAIDLILQKLEILLWTIQSLPSLLLDSVYMYLYQFMEAALLATYTSKYQQIGLVISDKFDKEYAKLKERMSSYPDLLKAFETISFYVNSKGTIQSFEAFQDAIIVSFKNAFEKLETRYIRLNELESLMVAAEDYEKLILSDGHPYLKKLGTDDDFISRFSIVMDKQDNPIEMRLFMGEILLRVMTAKMIRTDNFLVLFRGRELAIRFAELLDSSLEQVDEHLRKWNRTNKLWDYSRVVEILYEYSQIEFQKRDFKSHQVLKEKAIKVADKRQIIPYLVIFAWNDYLLTQDGSCLTKIDRLFQKLKWDLIPDLSPFLKLIECLVTSFLDRRDKGLFKEAEKAAIDVVTIPSPLDLGSEHIEISAAMFHAVHIFKQMYLARKSSTRGKYKKCLKSAVTHSRMMKEKLVVYEPLYHIARRTEALYAITMEDFNQAKKICQEDNSVLPPRVISKFNQAVEEWCNNAPLFKGRLFSLVPIVDYDDNEPWMYLLKKEILRRMNIDLEKHIVGSRAVVFTEGSFDDVILEKLTNKLYPKERITFMNAGGYSNIPYFAEARVAATLRMPIYLLFDGDVANDQKTRSKYIEIKKSLELPENHIKVLPERSIEAYFLVPALFRRAFSENKRSLEEIKKFIASKRTKQNKKTVLEELLSFCGLPKYNIEIAGKLASNLMVDEIELSLISIIKDFCEG